MRFANKTSVIERYTDGLRCIKNCKFSAMKFKNGGEITGFRKCNLKSKLITPSGHRKLVKVKLFVINPKPGIKKLKTFCYSVTK